MNPTDQIEQLTREFVARVVELSTAAAFATMAERLGFSGATQPTGANEITRVNGRVKIVGGGPVMKALEGTTRRKPPVQYCPVPRCKGIAAPIFGMVCRNHKDVPRAEIVKYREARKARVAAEAKKAERANDRMKAIGAKARAA